jgi:predicted aminopeptidase
MLIYSKGIIPVVVAAMVSGVFSGCNTYLVKQGRRLLSHHWSAKKIDVLLDGAGLDERDRAFFLRVKDIKSFAEGTIGLARNKNFSTYVVVDRGYLIDLVAASPVDRLEPYRWRYPIMGSFPYRGFYERADAEREADVLRVKGYDVTISESAAFSSGGILTDPVYSYMREYSVFTLASIIIHEETHATLFVKNRMQFNEELATFIGTEGALAYIRARYGEGSEEYRRACDEAADRKTYRSLMGGLASEMKALFASGLPRGEVLGRKTAAYEGFRRRMEADGGRLFRSNRYKRLGTRVLNNAGMCLFITYNEDLSLYYDMFDKTGHDLRRTLGLFRKAAEGEGDPKIKLSKIAASL